MMENNDEKKYGTMKCTSTNENESPEGSHSCIVGLINAIMDVEREGFVITEAHLDITFLDPGHTETNVEGKIIDVDDKSIIIDTMSIERLKNFAGKKVFQFLKAYEDVWMEQEAFDKFVSSFMKLYIETYGEPADPDFDETDWACIYSLIDTISNGHYKLKHLPYMNKWILQYSEEGNIL